jgi:hypothetical protein
MWWFCWQSPRWSRGVFRTPGRRTSPDRPAARAYFSKGLISRPDVSGPMADSGDAIPAP